MAKGKDDLRQHACYVLLTCAPPDHTGHMEVALTYEGDEALAAYLVDGAKQYFADKNEEYEGVESSSAPYVLSS